MHGALVCHRPLKLEVILLFLICDHFIVHHLCTLFFLDSRDFLPRRSRRSVNKKLNGHRTELGTFKCKPSNWDPDEVAEFLKIHGYAEYADPFIDSEIDGQSLFLLREQHLMERFNMKLGPALTLLDTICRLRHPPLVS